MHTLRDARIFVDSLSFEQRRALANELLLGAEKKDGEAELNALAVRLCDAMQLMRAVFHIAVWKRF